MFLISTITTAKTSTVSPRSLLPLTAILPIFLSRAAGAGFVIDISYVGDAAYGSAFAGAKQIWKSLLSGYRDGTVLFLTPGSSYAAGDNVTTVYIDASSAPDDGVGGRLGQAGVTQFVQDTSRFIMATNATVVFHFDDIALLSVDQRIALATPEVAHALGFGTLWTKTNVYINGSGNFTGVNATLAWQNELMQFGVLGTI